MKFVPLALLISSWSVTINAFSAVAPTGKTAGTSSGAPSLEPIDRTLKGIDDDKSAFDPTAGENSALTRNNKGEVWVSQVRTGWARAE